MDFGRKILEKYGYKEGTGLGKNSTGITAPIKALYKFDQTGLGGKDEVIATNQWWDDCYKNASSNLIINNDTSTDKIQIGQLDVDGVEITNKSYSMKKLKASGNKLQYGNFLKSSTLLADREKEVEGHVSTADIEIKQSQAINYDELFKACEGRTAHKGARHGLVMSGKLQRIAEQEKLLIERMKKSKENVFKEPARVTKRPFLNSSKDESSEDEKELPLNLDSSNRETKQEKGLKKKLRKIASKLNVIGISNLPEKDTSTQNKTKKNLKRKMIPQCTLYDDDEHLRLTFKMIEAPIDTKLNQVMNERKIKRARKNHDVPGIEKLSEGTRENFRSIIGDDDVDMNEPTTIPKKPKKYNKIGDFNDDDEEAFDIVDEINKKHHESVSTRLVLQNPIQDTQNFESSSKKAKKSKEKKDKEKPHKSKKSKEKKVKEKAKAHKSKKKEKFSTDDWEANHKLKVKQIEKIKRKQLKNIERRDERDTRKMIKKAAKQEIAAKAETLANGLQNVDLC